LIDFINTLYMNLLNHSSLFTNLKFIDKSKGNFYKKSHVV